MWWLLLELARSLLEVQDWRLGKMEQPSLVYSLSHIKALKCSFFSWLQKISLELPAVCSTKLAQTSETGFTCAPINWEVTWNL